MASFKELIVWQKGVQLTKLIYKVTNELPSSERFGLASQMQRAAVSIPSNIAEGYRRNNRKEYCHFCAMALGSAAELETQLIISGQVYTKIDVVVELALVVEIQKMLTVLVRKLSS